MTDTVYPLTLTFAPSGATATVHTPKQARTFRENARQWIRDNAVLLAERRTIAAASAARNAGYVLRSPLAPFVTRTGDRLDDRVTTSRDYLAADQRHDADALGALHRDRVRGAVHLTWYAPDGEPPQAFEHMPSGHVIMPDGTPIAPAHPRHGVTPAEYVVRLARLRRDVLQTCADDLLADAVRNAHDLTRGREWIAERAALLARVAILDRGIERRRAETDRARWRREKARRRARFTVPMGAARRHAGVNSGAVSPWSLDSYPMPDRERLADGAEHAVTVEYAPRPGRDGFSAAMLTARARRTAERLNAPRNRGRDVVNLVWPSGPGSRSGRLGPLASLPDVALDLYGRRIARSGM